ncbi:MAG TPA: transcriptional repressor [Solirubrobacteraceae bacterium]|nr:transcriptional repressor [Solirubrobacteraceae bacterium]
MGTDDAGDLLRRHHLRSTPQRRAILAAFRGTTTEHLSAEEVLARAASSVPEIGRGTVYATLAELAELGLLASVGSSDPVRYETNLAPHDHFHCRLCMRLFDVELGGRSLRRRRLDGFTIERVAVRGEGICRACGDYLRGLDEGAAGILATRSLGDERISALACAEVESPIGALGLAASPSGIVRVAFADHADADAISARSRSRRGPGAARDRLRAAATTLEGYFDGDRTPSADLLDHLPDHSSDELLDAVRRIPYAESTSYELLGDVLTPYESGLLLGGNPVALLVPCHRVSRGSERPEGYVGGRARLRFLHDLEARDPL